MEKVTTVNTITSLLLKEQREGLELSQTDVSKMMNITSAGWGKIEKGQSTISLDNLFHSCAALGISPSDIINKAENVQKQLQADGWRISAKKTEEDGLLAGSRMTSSLVAGLGFGLAALIPGGGAIRGALMASSAIASAITAYKLIEEASSKEK